MTDYEKIKTLFQEIGVDCECCDETYSIEFPHASPYYECGMSFDKNGKFEDVYVMG